MSACNQEQHQLPTTTTFLPILDDLLSPDFRPVTHPCTVTPLQTPVIPTKLVLAEKNECLKNENVAAVKIQKWWKNRDRSVDLGDMAGERAKHSVRHRRAEEHIRALESEVTRLKSSLATERKLRSLQYEAIRSLWSQVQKLTVNNPNNDTNTSIMTQSLPNGIPLLQKPVPPTHCTCAAEMTGVVQKLEEEISELRNLIMQSVVGKEEERSALESSTSSGSTKANKRPDSLDLNGGGKVVSNPNAKPEELQGYANDMAKFVVERGISDNLDGCGDGK